MCTDGTVSGAALDLIAGLANADCSIMARADIDTAGFIVVETVEVTDRGKSWRESCPPLMTAMTSWWRLG